MGSDSALAVVLGTGLTLVSPSRRKGQIGALAEIRTEANGYTQTYAFNTHGMTSDAVVARVAELEAYHDAKTGLLVTLRGLLGTEFTVGDESFRIVDCTIFDKGVTLYVDVRNISQDSVQKVAGFPMRVSYRSLDAIPDEAAILAMTTARIPEPAAVIAAAHAVFVGKVTAKRGG